MKKKMMYAMIAALAMTASVGGMYAVGSTSVHAEKAEDEMSEEDWEAAYEKEIANAVANGTITADEKEQLVAHDKKEQELSDLIDSAWDKSGLSDKGDEISNQLDELYDQIEALEDKYDNLEEQAIEKAGVSSQIEQLQQELDEQDENLYDIYDKLWGDED